MPLLTPIMPSLELSGVQSLAEAQMSFWYVPLSTSSHFLAVLTFDCHEHFMQHRAQLEVRSALPSDVHKNTLQLPLRVEALQVKRAMIYTLWGMLPVALRANHARSFYARIR